MFSAGNAVMSFFISLFNIILYVLAFHRVLPLFFFLSFFFRKGWGDIHLDLSVNRLNIFWWLYDFIIMYILKTSFVCLFDWPLFFFKQWWKSIMFIFCLITLINPFIYFTSIFHQLFQISHFPSTNQRLRYMWKTMHVSIWLYDIKVSQHFFFFLAGEDHSHIKLYDENWF